MLADYRATYSAKVRRNPADNGHMDDRDTNHIGDTVRIRRPPRVTTDERGRTVWMGEIESCGLELVESAVATNPYDNAEAIGRWRSTLR